MVDGQSQYLIKMPARRRISPRQMEILINFAEENSDVAMGRFSGGPLSSQAAKQAWEAVAIQLNAVAEGSSKTSDQWRRYWIEFKAKTKTRAADSRRNATATGGGPNKLIPLSDLEQRVLALIGPVAVGGLPGVRIPINIQSSHIASVHSVQPHSSNNLLASAPNASPEQNPESEEWLVEEWLETPPITAPPMDQQQQEVERLAEVEVNREPELRSVPEVENRNRPPAASIERQTSRRRGGMNSERQVHRNERVPSWAQNPESEERLEEEWLETPPITAPPMDQQQQEVERPAVDGNREPELRSVPEVEDGNQPPAVSIERRRRGGMNSVRRANRNERVPTWAYDLESRRIAAEERHTTAMEAIVELLRQIRDDFQNFIRLN